MVAGDECELPDHAQNDETALSVDVGYYLDFDVDAANGRPRGCPSFESKANGGKLRVGGQHFLVKIFQTVFLESLNYWRNLIRQTLKKSFF